MSNRHRLEPCPTVELVLHAQIEHIDAGIVPLVKALNMLPGISTLSSCEGHPWSEHESRAYVTFVWHGVDVTLRLYPEDIERLAAALEAHR